MWGWFIAIFIGMWLVQFLLTKVQMKNYQDTLKKLSNRPSGFLGVGVQKQKIGIGVIAILVTDVKGKIVESEVMQGVTVFSRFKSFTKFNGLSLDECKAELHEEPIDLALKMAIDKIEHQMKEKK
ncbi:transcriptional regulator GutM [Alkalihalobacillus sp. BA299]|uniref:transcriptional regulator GutM n=1 Tax=Alkalihalobacillus sp. BA299 TaxID=2815938 RepID=UPI001ADBC587|nr:transcriptional regulator GutM [Alkalihalobacillus sp. BA299]